MPKLAIHQVCYVSAAWPRMQQGCGLEPSTAAAENNQNVWLATTWKTQLIALIGHRNGDEYIVGGLPCVALVPNKQPVHRTRIEIEPLL